MVPHHEGALLYVRAGAKGGNARSDTSPNFDSAFLQNEDNVRNEKMYRHDKIFVIVSKGYQFIAIRKRRAINTNARAGTCTDCKV